MSVYIIDGSVGGVEMHICKLESPQAVALKAADLIQDTMEQKPNCILGLATGSTPVATYQELIKRYKQGKLDFSQVKTFNLDEYYGLSQKHPQSYYTFMQETLFKHINLPSENIHIPLGTPEDIEAYCQEYEQRIINVGGIDLQILGIGNNGHIGFNEPAHQLEARTHLVRLSEKTIEANARFFTSKEEVPRYAITMGIRSILSAKKILLLALGKEKAEIIRKLTQTGVTPELPASFLRLHPEVYIIVDKEAGSGIASEVEEYCPNEK